MLIVRRLALVAALLVCVGATAQPLQPPPNRPQIETKQKAKRSHNAQQIPKAIERDCPPVAASSVSITCVQAPPSQPEREHSGDEGSEFWPPLLGYRVKVTDSLLVLFTFLLWLATRRLVRDASQASERQLRAYVTVKGASIDLSDPLYPVATVQIINVGQTPAYNIRQWIHQWTEEHPLKVPLPNPDEQFGASESILAPQTKGFFLINRRGAPIPVAVSHLIGTAQGTIYVYGRIVYTDVFKAPRWLNFRFIYGGSEPVHGHTLKADSEGNDTSES